jgi:lipopolysaccharide export LptBFGC system permease protein LptF
MATDQRFDPYDDQAENRPRNWLTTCLVGCLIMVVVVAVGGAIVAYWVSQNWRDWASAAGAQGITMTVNESDLPEEEKQEINSQVERVADAFRDGDLSIEQVGVIIGKVAESPILPAIVVFTADEKYLNQSGLSDEEKAQGRISLQRFVRGAMDEKIDQDSVDVALAHIADRQEDGTWKLRDQVTDEQLSSFLATAKTEADEANIPEESRPFDPSDEIKRLIDEAMAQPVDEPVAEPVGAP